MALYLIGDLQGCRDSFERLLTKLSFSPSRDRVILLGDLVNRGPDSLGTLQTLISLGNAATCLLGNHDLHLLGIAYGVRNEKRHDTVHDILTSPQRNMYIDWLRHQHLAWREHGWLMLHAGVVPQWDAQQVLEHAHEVEQVLRSPDIADFMQEMYGNQPDLWREDLSGSERLRFIVNTLTRTRFCSADGRLDFQAKESAGSAGPGLMPWFKVPGRRTENTPIAFGHWSTLGLTVEPNLLALDTGCVWGGELTAAQLPEGPAHWPVKITQVHCPAALDPLSVK